MKLTLKNDNAIEVLPEAVFEVSITNGEVKQSDGKPHPYINWEFTIVEGEHKGRKVWDITSLAPNAIFRLTQLVSVVFDLPEGEELDFDTDVDIRRMIGKRLAVKVYTDSSYIQNGKPQPRSKVAKNGYFPEGYSAMVANDDEMPF